MAPNHNKINEALISYGIPEVEEIYYNLSYDELFSHVTNPELEGYDKGFETDTGAVAVDTGIFTGRSPKDKFIVDEETSRDNIWWKNPLRKASDNKPVSEENWKKIYAIGARELTGKKLYVMDGYAGANEDTRMRIRVVTEVAWMAHFVKNMFIRPSEEELENFVPDFVMLNACKTNDPDWKEHGLHSEVFAVFNLKDKRAVVGGTWYGGEIKKGFFSIMNYYLPLKGIAAMHCSANVGKDGDTAIFFGLSGTGKTTLSADPKRALVGDDEHGWDDDGIFNFEGGCYAKCIKLSEKTEPDIYRAIRRDALLENVVYDENGKIDFNDSSKTQNTRVSYPIFHIDNIIKPVSKSGHPSHVIFLTCDSFGVLPPVSKLTEDQTKYHFLSGYTAKVAGTERGIDEPVPSFSACFGAAFLLLHPTVYADELIKKMRKHNATAYLVNTGWVGGPPGMGERMDLPSTRMIIDSILSGYLDDAKYTQTTYFQLYIPDGVPGCHVDICNPKLAWRNIEDWDKTARKLAQKFIDNFEEFTDTEEGKRLVAAGPQIK